MNHFDINAAGFQNNRVQGDAKKHSDDVLMQLSTMDKSVSRLFKNIANDVQRFSKILLQDNSTQTRPLELVKLAEQLCDKLMESHLELVEEFSPDFKKLRKQNQQLLFSDYILAANYFVGSSSKPNFFLEGTEGFKTSFVSSLMPTNQSKKHFLLTSGFQKMGSSSENDMVRSNSSSTVLVSNCDKDEIIELIKAMVGNGLDTMDDLIALLKLVKELGINISSLLMIKVAGSIQDFVEKEAAMIGDPGQLIQLVHIASDFFQGDFQNQINVGSVESKLADMLAGQDRSSQSSLGLEIRASNVLDITPVIDKDLNVDEAIADVDHVNENFVKSTFKQSQDLGITPNHGQAELSRDDKVAKMKETEFGSMPKNDDHNHEIKEAKLADVYDSLAGSLYAIIEKNELDFRNNMRSLLLRVSKQVLSDSMDDFV